MPRHARLEDVVCAICMDSLFDKRDDLDDRVPTAAPDCGHVFHEPCVLEWFRTQSTQYLNAAREQGWRGRQGSPSLSDAPAECPACRAECFADPETGEPTIHRLYIDFGEGDGHPASSSQMIGSSPIKPSRKGKEKEVLGLARRAKGVGQEVLGLNAESAEEDVEGMMRRAHGLVEDVISVKALSGVKTYIGGLTTAINNLRTALVTHPLIPTLREQVTELRHSVQATHDQMHSALQREVKKAQDAEKAKSERRLKRAEEEFQLVKRELEKEQATKKASRQAMLDREREAAKRLTDVERQLEKEKDERESLQSTLAERNKQIKTWQKKAEERKNLLGQLKELQAENARLKWKAELSELTGGSPSNGRGQSPAGPDESVGRAADLSIQDIYERPSPAPRASGHVKKKLVVQDDDESLQIDLPSYDGGESLRDLSRFAIPSKMKKSGHRSHVASSSTTRSAGPSRAHPTARIMQFDLEEGLERKKRKISTSKYFPGSRDASDAEGKENEYPRVGGKRGRVMVEASSPQRSELEYEYSDMDRDSPISKKRSVTNPFVSTKEKTERRKELPKYSPVQQPVPTKHIDVIDLASSSPPPQARRQEKQEQKGTVGWLNIKDTNGRLLKGVAMGQKVKRRAQ